MCAQCPPAKTGRRKSASSAPSRLLVMDCPTCPGYPLRAAYGPVVTVGYPVCSGCGSRYVFRCPGEHLSYCEARDDDEPERHPVWAKVMTQSQRGTGVKLPRTGNVAPFWSCHCCTARVRGENAQCRKCRSYGPHYFGEEAIKFRKQRRRGHSPAMRAAIPAPTTDLPF